jgi:hypothetical protein
LLGLLWKLQEMGAFPQLLLEGTLNHATKTIHVDKIEAAL